MPPKKPEILTVSQITARLRGTLERAFPALVVEGEIGTWSVAPSGHAYFAIKDEDALLNCVMWRSTRERLAFSPAAGDQVQCRGKITLFEKRGQYQLMVDGMQLAGEGELWQKFQELKAKLEAEGLFDQARKRALPQFPKKVGVITSPKGAAIRDILNIIGRRAPSLSVLIYPARVQGAGAGLEIARAVERLSKSGGIDVLIVGRGGGSMEDLWEFNDERLARAIFKCPVPVVSAVGHETDFGISDFVADLRAPTPSAAAEIVTEGYVDLREYVLDRVARSRRAATMKLRETRRHVEAMLSSHALRIPELTLREYQQRVDSALRRMPELVTRRAERLRASVERLTGSLEGHNPQLILQKGYAIIRRDKDGRVLTRAERLKNNLKLEIELQDGKRRAIITEDSAPELF